MESFVRNFAIFIIWVSLSLARRVGISVNFQILIEHTQIFHFFQECLRIDILNIRHEQIGGYINITSTFLNDTFVDIRFDLLQTLANPTWGIEFTRWGPGQSSTNLFNTSILICQVERLSRRNLYLKMFRDSAKGMTNFTFACPLPAGRYFMRFDMDGIKSIFPGRLFYQENTFLTIIDRFYEQIQKGNHILFAQILYTYQIKRFCQCSI